MNRFIGAMLIAIFIVFELPAQFHPDYENPEVFERNQEPPHATLMPYENMNQALRTERKSSPFHHSLNGAWKFHWAENPHQAPEGFFKPGYDRGDWQEILVPSNWQMEGFGYPLFRNVGLPHPHDPPEVPGDFNPVGSYFRTFVVPSDWKGRQVFLHFEGVQSASYVWINGKEVGYNQGGMEPAEYNITGYLKRGENSIAVKVLRYSDGSYMEDQDTWRLSGIYRDVYLVATPNLHIRDYYITTDLDENYTDASLNVVAHVANQGKKRATDFAVRVTLFDQEFQSVLTVEGWIPGGSLNGHSGTTLTQSYEVKDPRKWSAEFPNLYTLVLELLDEKGEVTEVVSSRVGFREVEVINQAICINGVPVKFNGVNSHMMHPGTGHAMDVETMRKDLHLMKQFNINCVRTSHYPPNVEYLDLADELGIYVVDETGDEAHAYTYLSSDPLWRNQYLDRMRKMVYRDRNHPSVVIWSAGNESGPGDNICALIAEGKKIDPSRPAWMYGGNQDEDPLKNPIRCEDVVGPRYLQPFRLEQRFGKSDDPRPSFMDEYIAATGNSLGGLDEYWDLIYKYPRLTGGAIWDWISPGITQPVISTRDESPGSIKSVFINKAHLVEGHQGQALYLSGHDDWLEVSRDPALDITGKKLTLSFWVKPEVFNGNGSFLTKGDYQFGIVQPHKGQLEFYLNNGRRSSLLADLPNNWTGQWHHVAGIYDGQKMELYLDGAILGTRACTGTIVNAPYGVTLGKSGELRDGHQGYMCHATMDQVRIFGEVIPMEDLEKEPAGLKSKSVLWLDFETASNEGTYYSIGIPGRTYGLVWPDRSIQPELWQLKKSPQPVAFTAIDMQSGVVEISNRYHFRNLKEMDFKWQLTEDGVVIQKGVLDMELPAGKKKQVSVPFTKPDSVPGAVYHLTIVCSTRADQLWADAGHEVAWEQFSMPFLEILAKTVTSTSLLSVVQERELLKISGDGFAYAMDTTSGRIASMIVDGKELIRKGPVVNVWRAPLANDLDSWNFWHTEMGHVTEGMGKETANGWRSIGLDQLAQDVDQFRSEIQSHRADIWIETSIHSMNYTTGFKVHYHYVISGSGEMEISTRVSPRGYMTKWIPKLGLQMELSNEMQQMEWLGRGPFENYPDRKTGARTGRYSTTVEEDYVPYIIPQDYGNRTDTHWCKVTDHTGRGLLITSDDLFNFSVQKYSTENLDRAHYTFQLKEEPGVTLNLDHRVTGVGGTALSVLNPYRVLPGEYEFSFTIKPVK
ncbi:MAG: glycoside hydrolase family 2 [Bacteroidetes bacterium]|nr:MAG: glycoside hydrolase family 2 [Bacteroidota bacterium]